MTPDDLSRLDPATLLWCRDLCTVKARESMDLAKTAADDADIASAREHKAGADALLGLSRLLRDRLRELVGH